ncbi:MAG: aat [Frankiales bacterium]|nr:aat [Frankiales bacterium]
MRRWYGDQTSGPGLVCGVLFDDIDVAAAPLSLVAVGGRLDPPTLRSAYRNGVFPWPASEEEERRHDKELRKLVRKRLVPLLPDTPQGPMVPWTSPHPRAVLLTHQLSVPRSVRQLMRRCGWTTTVDVAFEQVLAHCSDRAEGTWITGAMRRGYTDLHREGGAHSVEVWDGDRLVGGLYGVLTGRLFSGESMFFLESGASKVAVVDLCRRLVEADVPVLDTQTESEHLRAMGQVLAHRDEYLEVVRSLRDQPAVIPTGRRPTSAR